MKKTPEADRGNVADVKETETAVQELHPVNRSKRRWGILFFAVCLQWAVLIFSPLFVYNSIKTPKTSNQAPIRQDSPNATDDNRFDDRSSDRSDQQATVDRSRWTVDTGQPTAGTTNTALEGQSPRVDPFPTTSTAGAVPSFASTGKEVSSAATSMPPVDPFTVLSAEPSPSIASKAGSNRSPASPSAPIPPPESPSSPEVKRPESPEQPILPSAVSQYEIQLAKAKKKFEEAGSLTAIDPERALLESLQAVELFRKLGQSLPSAAYWIISQAYASQSWGEALIEESPPIENMAISSDSRWLLTQCNDNTIWIWDIFRSQKTTDGFKLDSGESPFVKLLFTPDFRLAIGGESDGTIRIWDTSLKKPAESVVTLRGTVRGMRDLQVSPDGRWLAAYGSGSLAQVAAERPVVPIRTAFDGPIGPIANDVQEKQVMPVLRGESATTVASTKLAPRQSGRNDRNRPGLIIPVNYETPTSPAAGRTGSPTEEGNVVWLWDLQQLQKGVVPQPIALRGHEKPIYVMTISSDSRWLVTGSEDATARIYDLKGTFPGADQAVLKGHESGITAIAIPAGGHWVATGSRDNTVRLWSLPNAKSPSVSTILPGHIGWISSLTADEKGDRLISGSYDKTIRIWNIPKGDLSRAGESDCVIVPNDQGTVLQLLLSRDGKTLVSLGSDASLRIRELSRQFGQEVDPTRSVMIRNRTLPITRIALTPDNHWIVFNYVNQRDPSNSGVRLWPIRIEKLVDIASAFGQ